MSITSAPERLPDNEKQPGATSAPENHNVVTYAAASGRNRSRRND